jgi:SOS response regulatory protein OraA/RecX
MQRQLARKGYTSEEVEAALVRLTELGYLDDLSFAEGLVRVRSASRGPRALSAELARRGVARDQADLALASYDDGRTDHRTNVREQGHHPVSRDAGQGG